MILTSLEKQIETDIKIKENAKIIEQYNEVTNILQIVRAS